MAVRSRLEKLCFCLLFVVMGLLLCNRAARKPFWFDEILTLRIAQNPVGPEMWRAITTGFEFNPPAAYVATRWSELAFGRGPVSSRLPEIAAGLVTLLCSVIVASHRGGGAVGFGTLFLLFWSGAFPYFIEARGYALVMAGTMIAWVCWQRLVDHAPHRPLLLLGISAGLTLALASHMWAIVIPGCFVASALSFRLRGKPLDVPALAAMGAPGVVALCYPPIVAASRSIRFGGIVYETRLSDTYRTILGDITPLLVACVVVFTLNSLLSSRKLRESQPVNTLPLEDAVLAVCLLGAPAAIFVITKLTHGAFMPRYALTAILGLAFLLSQLLASFVQRARVTSYLLLFVIGLGLSAYCIREPLKEGWQTPIPLESELTAILHEQGDELVVFASGLDFLQADYYATPEIAPRLAFVADRGLARQITGTDGMDAALVLGSRYLSFRGQIVSYLQLQQAHRGFWLVESENPLNWISQQLRRDGADMRVLNIPNLRILHVVF